MGHIADFVDDVITIVPHTGDNWRRGSGASLLTIHTVCIPEDGAEPLPWDDVLSSSKLKEEGTVSEEIIVLGWKINTRSFVISLPIDKFQAWMGDITSITKSK